MTAVFIRGEDWAEGAHIADVPFDQLDTVIPTLKGWGIQDETPDLSAQFVYLADRRVAYFEVIIHNPAVSA